MKKDYREVTDVNNPRKELKLEDIPIHDPFVLLCEEDGYYYLYNGASPQGISKNFQVATGLDRFGVMTYRSKNLRDWEGPFIVFTIPDQMWADPMHGCWAPEVHEYKGLYYLFATLHNNDKEISKQSKGYYENHWRGTSIAVSDSPMGTFKILKKDAPYPPKNFMTLDGTLYIDEDAQPWMVYCHEWTQIIDGTIEAIRLNKDFSGTIGDPIHLLKGSDAPWINQERIPGIKECNYVTDGPQLYRTKDHKLLMLWSSYNKEGYVQTVARSESGNIEGPWKQLEPIVYGDSGHGMLFKTFNDQLRLILHSPFKMPLSRAYIYEIEDLGDRLNVISKQKS